MSDEHAQDYTNDNVVPLRQGVGGLPPREVGPLNAGGGGGTSDGMDAWQQSVETRLGAIGAKIDEQLKWLLIAFGGGFVVLAGLMLSCTIWLSGKVDGVGDKVADLNTAVAVLQSNRAASEP